MPTATAAAVPSTPVGGQVEGVADEGLTRGAEQHGEAQRTDLVQPVDQLQVVLHLLAEADAGVQDNVVVGDAGARAMATLSISSRFTSASRSPYSAPM